MDAKKVGFSELPILSGSSTFATPLKLYRWKLGLEPRPEASLPMKVGKYFEQNLFKLFCEEFNYDPGDALVYQPYFSNSYIHGYLDFFNEKTGEVFELKIVSSLKNFKAYEEQLNAQLGVVGVKKGKLIYLLNNYKLDVIDVDFDEKLFSYQQELAKNFIWHLENGVPPTPEAVLEYDNGELMADSEQICKLVETYLNLQAQIKVLEDEAAEAKEMLREILKGLQIDSIKTPLGTATLTMSKRVEYDYDAISKIIDLSPFKKIKEFEVFTIKKYKNGK